MPATLLFAFLTLTEPLKFGTNVSLTTPDNAVHQVECILQNMDTPFELQTLPWLRARREVKHERLDGYFTTHLTSEMSEYGKLSSPIYLENWYWFTHPESVNKDPKKLRYGVVHGSYQANWFKTQDITSIVEMNSLEEIVNVLHYHRVDKILLDLDDFNETARQLGIDGSVYQRSFYRYVPLGVFAANKLIDLYPSFLEKFDETIPQCAPAPFLLSKDEQVQILNKLSEPTRALVSHPIIFDTVAQSNLVKLSMQAIDLADENWVKEVKAHQQVVANDMLLTDASLYLKQWETQFDGVITETIVTDKQGKNVAISKVTSDYWQGDESKFSLVYKQSKAYHFSSVKYDASTHHFQVQLSVPIKTVQGEHTGVLILGIDVEKALSAFNGDMLR
ncbi:cellulose-binding family II protein [uncultured Pseudoalteromonas sp.]|uniref:cellulose-binding family II protein n=1 Tax=uncultured Pseudoalteromonas sp. TaxID=114053 RepID=UPI0030C7A355